MVVALIDVCAVDIFYAEALTLARALRSSKRRCFLRRMTL